MRRKIAGGLLILTGIGLGIYVGFYLCIFGGIMAVLNEIKSPEAISSAVIAWNIVRIVFAGLATWISALIFIIPGAGLLQD